METMFFYPDVTCYLWPNHLSDFH